MKKNVFKWSSVLISIIMILCCFTACNDNNTLDFDDDSMWASTESEDDSQETIASSNEEQTNSGALTPVTPSQGSNSNTAVDANNKEVSSKLDVKGKKCTILAPAEDEILKDYFKKYCNGNLEYIIAGWSECKLKLAQMCLAGNAPDIFRLNNQDYPAVVVQDLLKPLEQVVDLDSYTWKDYKDEMATYKYNGHYYVMPNRFTTEYGVWWNSSLFNQLGIKDTPDTHMKNGTWDWDALISLCKKISNKQDNRKAFAAHVNIGWWFDASAGETLVELTSKGLKNNLKNANIAKSRNTYAQIFKLDSGISTGYDSNEEALAAGKLGFYVGSTALGANDHTKALVANGTIRMAHFPKMPGSKDYKYAAGYSGYGIPISVKDTTVAEAFLTMLRVNEDYQNNSSAAFYSKAGMTPDIIKVYEEANQCEFIPITALGLNTCLNTINELGTEHVLKDVPWSTIVTKYYSKMQQGIDEFLTQGK